MILCVGVWCLSRFMPLSAQITLGPRHVFIDKQTGVGNVFIHNASPFVQEISVSLAFGYPGSDSTGNYKMVYDNLSARSEYSLDSMIRIYPRKFFLKENEQQVVRFQVLKGKSKKEGFYFTRFKVLSSPVLAKQEMTSAAPGASAVMKFEQNSAVFYNCGNNNTGILINKVETRQKGNEIEVKTHLSRTGNAPFLGTFSARITDKTGTIMASAEKSTAVYFEDIRSLALKWGDKEPGKYLLEIKFESRRNDMDRACLVQTPNIVHRSEILLE